jgi:hypothetical protein
MEAMNEDWLLLLMLRLLLLIATLLNAARHEARHAETYDGTKRR